MRVGICVRGLDFGGAELLECRLAADLPTHGIETLLIAQYSERDADQKRAAQGWVDRGVKEVRWLGAGSLGGKAASPARLARIIRRDGLDAIITSNPGLDSIGWMARRFRSFAHVAALHTYPDLIALNSSRGLLWRRAVADATRVYAVSDFTRIRAERECRVKAERITTIYNAVEHTPMVAERSLVCKELDIPDRDRLLLCVGRIHPTKGQRVAVEYLAPELERWRAHVLVVGGCLDGDASRRELNEIKAAADRAGVAGRVHVLGLRRDVPRLMAASDALVHLPSHEGFGLVLVEAMASGIAVVASDVGGIPEVLEGTPYMGLPLDAPAKIRGEVQRWLEMGADDKETLLAQAKRRAQFFSFQRRTTRVLELLQEAVLAVAGGVQHLG